MKNSKITVTTFKELKEILPETGTNRLPGIKQLYEMESDIYSKFVMDGGTITVFQNGFFLYERNGKWTVDGIDRCKSIEYEMADGTTSIPISDIEEQPYQVVLYLIGDHRLEHNMESNEDYYKGFGLANDGSDWCKGAVTPGFVEEAVALVEQIERETKELEKLKGALDKLTKRQREVIDLLYQYEMNQEDIAVKLMTSQANVSKIKSAALKKIKKYF